MNTITLQSALDEGYTHFMMAKSHGDKEEFYVYPLDVATLTNAIRRSEDKEYDLEEAAHEDDHFFGERPFLCNKKVYVTINQEWLTDKINDMIDGNDELAPNVMMDMMENLPTDEKFLQGIALINEAMSKFDSMTDTDIVVTL